MLCLKAFGFTEKHAVGLLQTLPKSGCEFLLLDPKSHYEQDAAMRDVRQLRAGSLLEVRDALWRPLLVVAAIEGGFVDEVMERLRAVDPVYAKPTSRSLQSDKPPPPLPLPPLRTRINIILNEPSSSHAALVIQLTILMLILVSTVCFCWETLPQYYTHTSKFTAFTAIEAVCITSFSIELVVRLVVDDNPQEFFYDMMNLIDLVSILPFYIELVAAGLQVPGLATLRVLRLARLLRILRVSQGPVELLAKTLNKSLRPLYMLMFMTCIVMLLFATCMYYLERGEFDHTLGVWMRKVAYKCPYVCTKTQTWACPEGSVGMPADTGDDDFNFKFPIPILSEAGKAAYPGGCTDVYEQSPFESIPQSCWWSLVTMTTVGYGDMVPQSAPGKVLGMVCQLAGILCIALPVTVIGSNFTHIYEKVARKALEANELEDDVTDEHIEDALRGTRANAPKLGCLKKEINRQLGRAISNMAKKRFRGMLGISLSSHSIERSTATTPNITPHHLNELPSTPKNIITISSATRLSQISPSPTLP